MAKEIKMEDILEWRGIRPVPPEKERTANAAILLLKGIEDGTAVTKG